MSCQHENGGFGAAPRHDAHLLSTCSAIQILAMTDSLDVLETRGKGKAVIGKCAFSPGNSSNKNHLLWSWYYIFVGIASLQNKDTGTFAGDEWGEEDTRFLYAALLTLSLLHLLDLVDVEKAVSYVVSCQNFDGGYGLSPGAESHSGQIFTCVAALAIAKRLDVVDTSRLGQWLSERQVSVGGLNGRPEKLEVGYINQ